MNTATLQTEHLNLETPAPAARGLTLAQFKARLDEAKTELEVRRLFHWHFADLRGTPAELMDAMQFADARASELRRQEDGGLRIEDRDCAKNFWPEAVGV
jgi:hypothetical protein